MEKPRSTIVVRRDLEGVSQETAELFQRAAREAVSATDRFTVALSGGSTPKRLYELLAEEPYRSNIAWDRVYLFWGDDRHVPPQDKESNYRMAREALITHVPIPESNVFRMQTELPDAKEAAQRYERTLQDFFGPNSLPRMDLILLGMGPDGHTASLFPETAALDEKKQLVTANWVEKLSTWRITLTLPVINAAKRVVFQVVGREKSAILNEVLQGPYEPRRLPSQSVRPVDGRLFWILDREADAERVIEA